MEDKEESKNLKYVYNALFEHFGPQGWWPINGKYHHGDYSYPKNEKEKLEIIHGAILTQNTSWNNVEKALINIRNIDVNKIEEKKLGLLIKSSGYFNQKASRLKLIIEFLKEIKEPSREELLKVKGIGPETADSILLYAFKQPYFVIDTYTKRIFSRLGYCKENVTYEELQKLFHKGLESDYKVFNEFHALLVQHAKVYCKKIPECRKCPLNKFCNFYKDNFK